MRRQIEEKLDRLRTCGSPRVLDLFSGCGGLFLGFQRAGCISVGGVEIDPLASQSYAYNFHAAHNQDAGIHASPKDITKLNPTEFVKQLGHRTASEAVDIIVGGPPCPTFTRVGRAKLREVNKHPEAFRHDPRAKLYLPYLRFVAELAPVALVMENVPDILNFGGHNLGEEICESLEEMGYVAKYSLLNAANFGVPQMRERCFFMAVHESAQSAIVWPKPTRRVDFPVGYDGSRQVALKNVDMLTDDLFRKHHYVPPHSATRGAPPPVTAEEALGDLAPITIHLEGKDRRGARRFDKPTAYRAGVAPSRYAQEMRTWPGFESPGHVCDHVTRCLSDRDYRLFARLKPGDQYPEAYVLAEKLFEDFLRREKRKGNEIRERSAEYKRLRAEYVPPYDPSKFPNKWRKMEADQPARTLMAHLGKDSYSHIHYDSRQARVISVREAARLQSFPDGFVFAGTMNPAFRQIGNSVPPLLSFAVATALLRSIGTRSSIEAARSATALEETA